jgi:hypothetical protein
MAAEANNVTLSTNFNVAPFYDDFNETKNFHRILFRPGLAVQARELTQMQTILQNQIDRFASNIFKEGSSVTGFTPSVDIFYNYVKIRDNTSTGTSVTVDNLLNKTLRGTTSGVRGLVIKVNDGSEANTPNFKTLFVKYISANTNGTKRFSNNEILTDVSGSGLTCNTITATQGGTAGYSFVVNFDAGVVYAKDHFIRVPSQTVVVGKYTNTPTAKVGFDISEQIITELSDSSLLDPASGSYNYAAPGASRLKLVVNVASYAITAPVSNTFVEILQVKEGILQSINDRPQYAAIRDYIASRTSDESGDYIVNGYGISLNESLKTSTNFGYSVTGNSNYLIATVQPGKAYVKGYDVTRLVPTNLGVRKATDYASVQSAKSLVDYGNYLICDNVVGAWDLNYQTRVTLRDTQANSVSQKTYSLTTFPGAQIGTARVRGIEYYSGTPGAPDAQYKVYVTDIKMNAGKSFVQVQSLAANTGTGSANGKADILYSNGLNANTYDASFDRAIFKLPANYVRRLRDTSGNVNNDYSFYKSFDITFNTSGVATINTGDTSETFDGSGVLSDDGTRTDFYIVARTASNTATLTGKVNVTNAGNTITAFGGTGTAFSTQVNKGDIISVANSGDYVVSSVNSDTSLNIYGTISGTKTNMPYFKKFKAGQVLDFAGTGKAGNRTITISGTPSTVATLALNEGTIGSTLSAKAIVTLNKIDGQEAAKTVVRNRLVQVNVGVGGGTSYTANTTGPWPLGMSDGFQLISVRKKTGTTWSTTTDGTDVTSHFTLDTGMTDNYYDHAKLVKKPASSLTITNGESILVKFDHFTHSYSSGVGYFSVDSYPVNDSTAGTDTTKIYTYQIPLYTSKNDGTTYDLRNCIDIRPRVSDSANSVSALTNISKNPLTAITFDQPSGGLHFSPPGQDFTTDLDYYLRRKDIITLNKDGSFKVTEGIPEVQPRTPNIVSDAMTLGVVNLAPYPSVSQEIGRQVNRLDLASTLTKVKNERFTMRDIGVIRDRVDNLEYYTSLNALEKNAKDLLIPDTNGLDRFKNGILVDSFSGHNIGNVHDADYKISIDASAKEARPLFDVQNVEFRYASANSSNVVRTNVTTSGVSKDQCVTLNVQLSNQYKPEATVSSGGATATIRNTVYLPTGYTALYLENATGNFAVGSNLSSSDGVASMTIQQVFTTTPGDLVTLPYSHKVLVEQPFATTTRNAIGTFYNYVGEIQLNPDSDYWCDTTNRPDVNVNVDLNTDNWMWLSNSWQTDWNNWTTIWTGQENLTSSTTSVTGQYNRPNADGSQDIVQTSVTQNLYTTPTTEARTGTKPVVTAVNDKQSFGKVIRDVNVQPYMRSKRILFKAVGLKPSSRVYAFFDNVKVGDYVTPLTETEYNNGGNGKSAGKQAPLTYSAGSNLVTDSSGNVYGFFDLPNDTSLKFRTGQRKFRITDNPTNSLVFGTQTTSAETYYTAEGLMAGTSELTLSTRRPVITNQSLVENRTGALNRWTSSNGEQVIGLVPAPIGGDGDAGSSGGGGGCGGSCGGSDPIAQSFLITGLLKTKNQTSGMFITKVDLFFATKDNTFPVTIQLQELDPITSAVTNRVVPFSRVIMQPSQVNVSDDASAATPIYFPSPVYLEENKEYAISVIPAGCNPNYSCWTAVLGEKDITTGNRVAQQPASGFLFTSANQRTWVPVESEDLKFTVYYAEFDKTTPGTMIIKNEGRDYLTVSNSTGVFSKYGEFIHGETTLRAKTTFANTKSVNTNVTYVQGMVSGATGTITSFSVGQINVKNVSTNVKFKGGEAIRIRNTNSTTGVIIGNTAGSTLYSTTTPVGSLQYYDVVNFSNTKLHVANMSYTNSGPAYANSRIFKVNSYVKGQTNGYSAKIISIDNLVADTINLQIDSILPSNTNLTASAKYATSTSARDSSFFNLKINDNTELSSPRYILSRSVESNTAASSATMATNKSGEVKLTLRSFNLHGSPAVDIRRMANIVVNNLISSNAEIGSSEDWVQFGGRSKSRYITRIVTLADGQDAEDLRVYLAAYKPPGSDVKVYVKVLHSEDSDAFTATRWVPMNLTTGEGYATVGKYSSSQNRTNYIEFVYDMPTFPTTAITDSSGRAINQYGANTTNNSIFEYRNSGKARFTGFKQFSIKVVLTNDTSSNPPRIHELRAIALQR